MLSRRRRNCHLRPPPSYPTRELGQRGTDEKVRRLHPAPDRWGRKGAALSLRWFATGSCRIEWFPKNSPLACALLQSENRSSAHGEQHLRYAPNLTLFCRTFSVATGYSAALVTR